MKKQDNLFDIQIKSFMRILLIFNTFNHIWITFANIILYSLTRRQTDATLNLCKSCLWNSPMRPVRLKFRLLIDWKHNLNLSKWISLGLICKWNRYVPDIMFTPRLSNKLVSNEAVDKFLFTLISKEPSNPADRQMRYDLKATSILSK